MSGLGDAIAYAAGIWLICFAAIVAGITAGLIYGIPWLWALIKPWLHSITGA